MCDEPIAPYAGLGVDAGDELDSLGLASARYFLLHMQSVVSRKRNYLRDRIFHAHDGTDIYKADLSDHFILYIVEVDDDGSLCVTLMCAGRVGDFVRPGEQKDIWSHAALAAVKKLVELRVEDLFR